MEEIYSKIVDIVMNTAINTSSLNELEHNRVIYHLQIKVVSGGVIATLTVKPTKKTEQCLMYRVYTRDKETGFIALTIIQVMNKYEATLPVDWVPISEQVDEEEVTDTAEESNVEDDSADANMPPEGNPYADQATEEINESTSEETSQEEEENDVSTDI
jgi:hypothetical protein